MARVFVLLWIVATCIQAASIRADPPVGGPLLGIETALVPGASTIAWEGPYGRRAELGGDGRFEVWRHPLWTPTARIAGAALVVDHPIGWREAIPAALARSPVAHGLAMGLIALAILLRGTVRGGVLDAALLAAWLRGVHALDPAWALASDAERYHRSALDVLAGHLPHALWPPAWPVALAGAYGLFGADPLVGRLLGAALGVAFVPLVARLAPVGPARVATAVLAALSAELVGYAPSLFAEPLFHVAAVVALGAAGGTGGTGAARAGLAAAIAVLTRAHALAVAPIAWLAGSVGQDGGAGGRRAWGVALAAPLLAWALIGGSFGESLGMNLWIGHRPGADGDWHDPWPAPPEGFTRAAIAAIADDPAGAAGRVVHNVGRLWNASTSDPVLATRPLPLPVLPFAGLVALAALGLLRWRPPALIVWLVATTVVTACFFVPVRYKLGLYPALLPLAGAGLSMLRLRTPAW